jgi:hypothetical protein
MVVVTGLPVVEGPASYPIEDRKRLAPFAKSPGSKHELRHPPVAATSASAPECKDPMCSKSTLSHSCPLVMSRAKFLSWAVDEDQASLSEPTLESVAFDDPFWPAPMLVQELEAHQPNA